MPASNGNQTYWVRQNWGTSTITLKQELLLPEGTYHLTADVWKSGRGGDAIISVKTQDGDEVTAPSLENMEAWQKTDIVFNSDGKASTTVSLSAMHNYNGTEKIIGYDNVVLTKNQPTAINHVRNDLNTPDGRTYDLQGRLMTSGIQNKGLYIVNGQKVVRH